MFNANNQPATPLFSVRIDRSRLRPHALLLGRAVHLPPADQSLLRLALEGRTFRDLSAIFNHSPGALHRRVRALIDRLNHPVVAAVCDFPTDLPDTHRRVGLQRFLLRRPLKAIAADLGQSTAQVREILTYLAAFAKLSRPTPTRLAV